MRLKSCGLLPLMTLFLSVSAGNHGERRPPQGDCPPGPRWHQSGNNCYYIHSESSLNQTEARGDCREKNAELTSINDAAEAQFLISNGRLLPSMEYWIGLMSNGSNVTYWLDGSNSTYRLPCGDCQSDDNSECFVMEREQRTSRRPAWEFSQEDCKEAAGYICERIIGIPTTHAEAATVTAASSMPSNGPGDAVSKTTGFPTTHTEAVTATAASSMSSNGAGGTVSKTTAGFPGTTSNDSFNTPAEPEADANGKNIGVAVGVSVGLGLVVLVAVIIIVIVVYRRRNTKQGCCRRYDSSDPYQSVDGRHPDPHVYQTMPNGATSGDTNYEELADTSTPPALVPMSNYDNRPATSAPDSNQSPYDNGETTLVDNALYGGETGKLPRSADGYEDVNAVHLSTPGPTAVTHHPVYNDNETTLMDNALYEKETAISPRSPDGYEDVDEVHANTTEAPSHQQSVYSDHDTTLVDNTLYGSETSAPTSNNPQNDVDYQDLTVIDNALYDRR